MNKKIIFSKRNKTLVIYHMDGEAKNLYQVLPIENTPITIQPSSVGGRIMVGQNPIMVQKGDIYVADNKEEHDMSDMSAFISDIEDFYGLTPEERELPELIDIKPKKPKKVD